MLIPDFFGVTGDYAQMDGGPIVVSDNTIDLAVNGTFFDNDLNRQTQPSALTPMAFNLRNPAGKTA